MNAGYESRMIQAPATIYQWLTKLANEPSPLHVMASALVQEWQDPPRDVDQWMNLMLSSERCAKLAAAGMQDNQPLLWDLGKIQPQNYSDIPPLPCEVAPQRRVGEVMLWQLGIGDGSATHVLLESAPEGRRVLNGMLAECFAHDISVDVMIKDHAFDTVLVNALNPEQLARLAAFDQTRYAPVTHHAMVRGPMPPEIVAQRVAAKFDVLQKVRTVHDKRRGNDEVRWILTSIPGKDDAALDGFGEYKDYLQFYFDACDQPWEAIGKAQQVLIDAFDKGRELHITNHDGTDIRMSLVGHSFANSLIARNIPGSEFFSGPVRDSVNGRIVAKGNFSQKVNGKTYMMKDLTLDVVDGRIMRGVAGEGQVGLDAVLGYDDRRDPGDPQFEGSRHFGEIGIGTNAFIRQHLVNSLLVEKISGSFHMAIGDAYGNSYLGKPTFMDNGNRSDLHWDITTMLRGKDGAMRLDGHLLQKDGEWIACPELGITAEDVDVLNRGWAALPEHQRPKYWRDKLAATAVEATR